MPHRKLKNKLVSLYEGESVEAHRFRYALLILDIATIAYLMTSTFFYGAAVIAWVDVLFGLYLAADYAARMWISPKKFSFVVHPMNMADMLAMLSFIAPLLGTDFSFLRALRILRLLRSYRLVSKLRQDFAYFQKNEDVILSSTNLFVFVFLMTELVFVTQVGDNPNVTNFLDALYFTIAALTTTGFGDVTLQGQSGRVLSIVVMVFGVSLFLRLMQTVFRPSKVRYICKECGLFLHDSDAVHCKHCGHVVNIPTSGTL